MRIFKNRGDIFFSDTNKEKSSEQKFLLICLVVIVLFTVVFVTYTAVKNEFSAKNFFRPDNFEITNVSQEEEEEYVLPKVSGKTNFAVFISDEEENELLFAYLLQVDMDNISYKLCAVKASTVCKDTTINTLFKNSGPDRCTEELQRLFTTHIDFYISMNTQQFGKIYDKFGTVNYPVLSDIRYKDNDLSVPLNFRIKSGEQNVKANQVINLVRYYLDVENNASVANDLLLTSLSQQINSENSADKEELFHLLITNCVSNITVRDFSMAGDNILVLSDDRSGVSVYNAGVKYKNNKITANSLKEAKGYFVK